MKKPYLNKDQRFLLTTDTLSGGWLRVHFAWKKALREIESDLKNGNKLERFIYKLTRGKL